MRDRSAVLCITMKLSILLQFVFIAAVIMPLLLVNSSVILLDKGPFVIAADIFEWIFMEICMILGIRPRKNSPHFGAKIFRLYDSVGARISVLSEFLF